MSLEIPSSFRTFLHISLSLHAVSLPVFRNRSFSGDISFLPGIIFLVFSYHILAALSFMSLGSYFHFGTNVSFFKCSFLIELTTTD